MNSVSASVKIMTAAAAAAAVVVVVVVAAAVMAIPLLKETSKTVDITQLHDQ